MIGGARRGLIWDWSEHRGEKAVGEEDFASILSPRPWCESPFVRVLLVLDVIVDHSLVDCADASLIGTCESLRPVDRRRLALSRGLEGKAILGEEFGMVWFGGVCMKWADEMLIDV